MEADKMDPVIFAMWDNKRGRDWYKSDEAGKLGCVKYIRADLVKQLMGYKIMHNPDCMRGAAEEWGASDAELVECTCGLSDLIKQIGGERWSVAEFGVIGGNNA